MRVSVLKDNHDVRSRNSHFSTIGWTANSQRNLPLNLFRYVTIEGKRGCGDPYGSPLFEFQVVDLVFDNSLQLFIFPAPCRRRNV